MKRPLLSVIVPVYKTEKYIESCIKSILNQTIPDLELILVDDGSPDKSGYICDEYAKKDNRVKVIHQTNGGVCAARNKGLDKATGEYICFVDSDDFLENNALEILCEDIRNHNADISCALMTNDDNCNVHNLENGVYEIWSDDAALKNALLDNRFSYSSCAKLFKSSLIGETRFEEGRKIHEDSFFVFCCFLKNPIVIVRNIGIYNYTANPQSASNAFFSEKFYDILYFASKKVETVKNHFPQLEDLAKNTWVKANLAMLHMFCNTRNKKHLYNEKQCIKEVKKHKEYFVPAVAGDLKWFKIINHNMYFLFKFCYQIKYKHRIK